MKKYADNIERLRAWSIRTVVNTATTVATGCYGLTSSVYFSGVGLNTHTLYVATGAANLATDWKVLIDIIPPVGIRNATASQSYTLDLKTYSTTGAWTDIFSFGGSAALYPGFNFYKFQVQVYNTSAPNLVINYIGLQSHA